MAIIDPVEEKRKMRSLIQSVAGELRVSLSENDVDSIIARYVKPNKGYDRTFFLDVLREDWLNRF